HARVLAESLADVERDVARGELRCRDLVQQRLELMVVVLVDQGGPDVVLRQLPRASEPRESRPDDHDARGRTWLVGLGGHGTSGVTGQASQRSRRDASIPPKG